MIVAAGRKPPQMFGSAFALSTVGLQIPWWEKIITPGTAHTKDGEATMNRRRWPLQQDEKIVSLKLPTCATKEES
jgi:hypothetical protein